MKITFICPTSYLEKLDQFQDMYLLLPHIADKDPQYKEFFRQNKKFKIMDNSASELGNSYDFNKVIDLALELNCDEIVLPDKLYDVEETMRLSEEGLKLLDQRGLSGKFSVMAVPQGSNYKEYIKSFERFQGMSEVDILGAGFWITAKCFQQFTGDKEVMPNRLMLTREIYLRQLTRKPIHLLGLGDCLEVKTQSQYQFIRSQDSKSAVKYGMAGFMFGKENGRAAIKERVSMSFDATFNAETLPCVLHNIEVLREFAIAGPALY